MPGLPQLANDGDLDMVDDFAPDLNDDDLDMVDNLAPDMDNDDYAEHVDIDDGDDEDKQTDIKAKAYRVLRQSKSMDIEEGKPLLNPYLERPLDIFDLFVHMFRGLIYLVNKFSSDEHRQELSTISAEDLAMKLFESMDEGLRHLIALGVPITPRAILAICGKRHSKSDHGIYCIAATGDIEYFDLLYTGSTTISFDFRFEKWRTALRLFSRKVANGESTAQFTTATHVLASLDVTVNLIPVVRVKSLSELEAVLFESAVAFFTNSWNPRRSSYSWKAGNLDDIDLRRIMPEQLLNAWALYMEVPLTKDVRSVLLQILAKTAVGLNISLPIFESRTRSIAYGLLDGIKRPLVLDPKPRCVSHWFVQLGGHCHKRVAFRITREQENDLVKHGLKLSAETQCVVKLEVSDGPVHPKNYADVSADPMYQDAARIAITVTFALKDRDIVIYPRQSFKKNSLFRAMLSVSILEYAQGRPERPAGPSRVALWRIEDGCTEDQKIWNQDKILCKYAGEGCPEDFSTRISALAHEGACLYRDPVKYPKRARRRRPGEISATATESFACLWTDQGCKLVFETQAGRNHHSSSSHCPKRPAHLASKSMCRGHPLGCRTMLTSAAKEEEHARTCKHVPDDLSWPCRFSRLGCTKTASSKNQERTHAHLCEHRPPPDPLSTISIPTIQKILSVKETKKDFGVAIGGWDVTRDSNRKA